MTRFVLYSSTALAWCFADETTQETLHAESMMRTSGCLVPGLWPLELATALLVGQRRGRVSAADRLAILARFERFPIVIDSETAMRATGEISSLADLHGLTVYDAAYLELAGRAKLPLATLDNALRMAAVRSGIVLLSP